MNQDQRKFLIEQVENTYREQSEELERQIPQKPSLNNYLIASFLDNSIQFADISILKKRMREAVLKMGHTNQLIKSTDDYWGSRKKHRDIEEEVVEIKAEDLFIIPDIYKQALKEYEIKKKEIDDKLKNLEVIKKTIILKLQLGSSNVLDKLITQADNMVDLNLVNTQLTLEDKSNSKGVNKREDR